MLNFDDTVIKTAEERNPFESFYYYKIRNEKQRESEKEKAKLAILIETTHQSLSRRKTLSLARSLLEKYEHHKVDTESKGRGLPKTKTRPPKNGMKTDP